MSSDADAAATAALFDGLYTGHYCSVAASVIFFYDALVTFDREVACFWTAKRTGASLLFFANKYISMTLYVMGLVQFASFPSDKKQGCALLSIATYAVKVLQFVPGAFFSALRAYVLSRSKLLGLLVFALSLAPVGANLVEYGYQPWGEVFSPFGCFLTDDTTSALDLRVVVISRAPLIVADILIIYITWTKLSSWAALRDIRQPSKRLSLSDILSRDGTIYFVILFILNVLHLVLSTAAVASDGGEGSYVTNFTMPITTILISRFLLELQEVDQMVVRLDSDDPLHSSRNPYDTPSFVSSLGGFVRPDRLERSEEGDLASPLDMEEESGAWGSQAAASSSSP
ncbi:hypothetical protein C8T65DRAFT_833181 [Cerioporus squamosus]|nr:hypothetical protein C8T65DRAFT_833181 [Cerioporus squamosus]